MANRVKNFPLFLCTALLLGCAPLLAAAADAGRFLVAVGDVSLLRNARVIPAVNGTPVEVGDQVRTGPSSSAQIRFSDSSIIAVKPQSLFTVSEYSFGGKEDGSEKALFNVIQGGLRTVTGLIGRINKRNYEVRTPTSTVGIRGTFWEMVHCGDCTLPSGQKAAEGTYYVVSDGTINVSNNGGSFDFGPNSAVFVANQNTGALRLVEAPPFVRDKLLTAAGATTRGSGSGDNGGVSSSAALGGTGTPSLTPSTIATVFNQQYVASNNTNADGSSAILGATSAFTGFVAIYTIGGVSFDGVSSCGNPPCNSNEVTRFSFNGNQLVSYGGAASGASLTSGGTLANLQTLTLSTGDVIVLGQLTGSYAGTSNGGSAFSGPGGFVFGATNSPLVNINSALPASGSFSFGSIPGSFGLLAVDAAGNTTTSGNASGFYNASSRTAAFSGTFNFANIAGFGAANFSVGGSGNVPAGSNALNFASLSWSCSGAGCQSAGGTGAFDARFIHSSTNIPAMVVDGGLSSATKNGASGNAVVFGAGMKCVSGAC